jgi:hypothetical protein
MSTVQRVRLESERRYGRRLPLETGRLMTALQPALRGATAMRFRGRSAAKGRPPKWWELAGRIAVTAIEGDEHPELVLDVPTVREVFPQLYEQGEIWPSRPDGSTTVLDLLGETIGDINEGRRDSEFFDPALLNKVHHFKSLFEDDTFDRVYLLGHRPSPELLDSQTVVRALDLRNRIPHSQPARIVGTLDMVWASRSMFALKATSGEPLYGTLPDGGLTSEVRNLMTQSVVVLGRIHFRPSGSVLRIDASEIVAATKRDLLFASVPTPLPRMPRARTLPTDRQRLASLRAGSGGLRAILGKWPGNETDEEIEEAMKEVE